MKSIIPTVKIWCLPSKLKEKDLNGLHQAVVNVMTEFPETGVDSESDMLNLFQPDLMTYGLGSEIKIEISDLPVCDKETQDFIARGVGGVFQRRFPKARIFCTAECHNPEVGVWSSH